jgi:hypothetical protein
LHPTPAASTARSWLARRFLLVGAATALVVLLLTAHQAEVLPPLTFTDHSDKLYVTLSDAIAAAPANLTAGWTDDEAPLHLLGAPASFVAMANEDVLDARTGEPFSEDLESGTFNLAVLKLPPGSKFQLLGIARGPTRKHPFMKVKDHPAREQSLVL